MLLSLIVGMVLGGLSVIFALQNVGSVSVSLLAWQVQAPIALVLLATAVSGVLAATLAILPRMIRDEFIIASQKRQLREAHEENAKHRLAKSQSLPAGRQVPTSFYEEASVHGPVPSIFG